MNRTLVIVKPDGVERSLVGEIISRFEKKGLKIVAGRFETIPKELAEKHYFEHAGKSFYDELVTFITRSPAFVCVLEGPEDTWKVVRTMMGPTNPIDAQPGTIRGDLGLEIGENLVHGSDSNESAAREIEVFFPGI
ncbi:MAG: nucleoside-diphosphate kinase [Acidimicrobiales bacterium]|nr:nucleoside-diphosphate kinase [Acidimicrobiales bacterium]